MFHSSLERDFKEQGTVVQLNFVGLVRKIKGNASRGCICDLKIKKEKCACYYLTRLKLRRKNTDFA